MPRLTIHVHRYTIRILICLIAACFVGCSNRLHRFEFTQLKMGAPFQIILYTSNHAQAQNAANATFARIDELNAILSDYDPDSELSRLSKSSGRHTIVPVSPELWFVLNVGHHLSRRTNGAFDMTVGPYTKLWRRARRIARMPRDDLLTTARNAVGYQHIRLHKPTRTVELTRPKMRLDLGGIAKGYATDEAIRILQQQGIHSALANAGGDLRVSNPPPGRDGWRIGIAPLQPLARPSQYISLSHAAIATSGDAFQFVVIDQQRYSHIIDPATGLGLTTRSSVTVIAKDGITADSLASAVSVLGPQRGIKLIDQTPHTHALIIHQTDPDSNPDIYLSNNIARLFDVKDSNDAGQSSTDSP